MRWGVGMMSLLEGELVVFYGDIGSQSIKMIYFAFHSLVDVIPGDLLNDMRTCLGQASREAQAKRQTSMAYYKSSHRDKSFPLILPLLKYKVEVECSTPLSISLTIKVLTAA